ncbi:MAG: MBL fold metallo-hydrolase [Catenulispora sp.]|nr:MBL fold metallo-hydrolase [Catenulispora sp.]
MRGPLVTSLGHAGLRVETPDLKLLCDPWVSPGGAFLGSWFPFPDNSRLRSAPGLLDADWVAVSHEHLDHMDLGFLAGLPDGVRVVIPRYPASTCRDRLTAAGVRHVVEVEAWRRLPLNTRGDWLTVIPEQSPMCHDAAFLVVTDGVSVLHTNDARLSLAQARRAMAEVGGPLDLMAVQMSGASWHPICYDYPSEVVAKICADKRSNKFKAVTRLVRGVKPRLVLPYAGPPCFLDPTLAHHNAQIPAPGIFPDQAQATAWLRERIPGQETLFMLPGDSVQLASSSSYAVTRDAHWEGFAFDDPLAVADHLEVYKASRAQEIADVWAAHPDPPSGSGLAERFAEHFGRLGRMNRYFLDRIAMTVRFDIGGEDGGVWDVQLGPERTVVDLDPKDRTNDAVQYKLTMEARWLDAVLRGEVRWEDLFLSLRFRSWRCPDVYNDYLVGLLKHADEEALQAVQDYETERDPDDTVTLRSGDRAFEVTRYCPHAGEDLTEGAVIEDTAEGPVLRCLAHNFGFSLTTGECLNARCDAIKVATAI